MEHNPNKIVTAMYRLFCKAHLYFCPSVVEMIGGQNQYFPIGKENVAIDIPYRDTNFSSLITNRFPDYSFVLVRTQVVPRWIYDSDGNRVSNINPIAAREMEGAALV